MPRAQRTKSAVHEALQRRARHGPGVGFSEELAGETMTVFSADILAFRTGDDCGSARIVSLARPAAHSRCGDRTIARQFLHHPAGLTTACSVAPFSFYATAGRYACRFKGRRVPGRAGGTVTLGTHGRDDAAGCARA
jgi:hypothetical protein